DGFGNAVCGTGWNCSFVVNFTAPGYKCHDFSDGAFSPPSGSTIGALPFDLGKLVPKGNFSYFVIADQGEYAAQQTNSTDGGHPAYPPPFPPHLGALRTEPIIWMGYGLLTDPTKPLPANASDPSWSTSFAPPKFFACEHYETAYVVQINYTGPSSQITQVL